MTDTVPPKPEPVDLAADPETGLTNQPPAVLPSAVAAHPRQVVTLDMDMIDRVMINHPGLSRETAQQALDAAGY